MSKEKKIRRWLIISYFANIDPMAPSHHIDDRLPYLRQKGIDICLLTSPCGAHYKNLTHKRIPSPAPSGIRYEVRYFLRRKTRGKFWFKFWETLFLLPVYPFYFIEKIFLRLDSTWSWFITATIVALILSCKKKPSIIYSTGGPVSAHIAAMTVSYLRKIPYITEFQDPLVHRYAAPGKTERYFIKEAEKLIFKTAHATVFLTQQAAENACKRNNNSKKSFTIYAGAVPRENMTPHSHEEVFNIVHFGSLGGSRNLDYIFKALVLLFRESPNLPNYFRLNLYGNNSRNVSKGIEQFPYREILNVKGKVQRQEAMEFMYKADVLLLIQNTDDVSFETIPSKVYEYLHTGRPVLALVYRNDELRSMLEGMGHIVVQADDKLAIKRGLEAYIERWKQNQLQSSPLKSPYTVEKAVDELVTLANTISKC